MSRVHIVFGENGDVVEYKLRPPPEDLETEASRGLKAMALAPTLEICQALLRGEKVPLERLDQEAVRRFWRRPR